MRLLFLLAALLAACGDDSAETAPTYQTFEEACAAIPGCGTGRFPIDSPPEPVFRVLVHRADDGTISIAAADRLELPSGDGIPVGPESGDVLLAGLDADGQPIDGQVLAFPRTLIAEGIDDPALYSETPITGATATLGFVRALDEAASLAVLDILDRDGQPLATAPLPTAEVSETRAGYRLAALTRPSSNSACGHVVILSGGILDRSWVPDLGGLDPDIHLRAADPIHLALVEAALARMPPMLCQGVRRVAFVELPDHTVRGQVATFAAGDLVMLNLGYHFGDRFPFSRLELERDLIARLTFMRVFTHETGHAVDALLGAHGIAPGSAGGWAPESRSLARRTIDRVRVHNGFAREWLRVHDSFEDLGWAESHKEKESLRPALSALSAEAIAHAGFMSWYGGTAPGDDIADAIAWPTMLGLYEDFGVAHDRWDRSDAGCHTMRAYKDGGVPSRLATLYTKLSFLQDLGLLATEDVDRCMGSGLGLYEDERGFVVLQNDVVQRRFVQNPSSRLDGEMYHFEADGGLGFGDTDVRARVMLRVPVDMAGGLPSWPRGVYPLSPLEATDLRFVSEEEPAASFAVTDGFLLVARASDDGIIGSAFVREGLRYDAPFPVPQVFDPPLVVTFNDDAP